MHPSSCTTTRLTDGEHGSLAKALPAIQLYIDQWSLRFGVSVFSNLRVDSLAQILNEANVRACNKLIVMESCLGLVLGAVMERMAGWY